MSQGTTDSVELVVAACQHLRPSHRYDFFVCHHKEDASGQARLLKGIMKVMKLEVFTDSNDLRHLCTLFDVVLSRVQHVIVYLTGGTLARP